MKKNINIKIILVMILGIFIFSTEIYTKETKAKEVRRVIYFSDAKYTPEMKNKLQIFANKYPIYKQQNVNFVAFMDPEFMYVSENEIILTFLVENGFNKPVQIFNFDMSLTYKNQNFATASFNLSNLGLLTSNNIYYTTLRFSNEYSTITNNERLEELKKDWENYNLKPRDLYCSYNFSYQ